MRTLRTAKKALMMSFAGGILLLSTGGCLPEDFWAGVAGNLVTTGINSVLALFPGLLHTVQAGIAK